MGSCEFPKVWEAEFRKFLAGKWIFCLYYSSNLSVNCVGFWVHYEINSFSSSLRTKENGFDREPLHSEHPSKRPCTISPGQRYSPNNGLSYQPNGLPHPTPPPPQHYRLDDMAIAHHYRDSYRHPSHRDLRDRNRPMGKTEGTLHFLWDWMLEDLHHYFSAELEAWNLIGVKILFSFFILSLLWDNLVSIHMFFNSCAFSHLHSLQQQVIYFFGGGASKLI